MTLKQFKHSVYWRQSKSAPNYLISNHGKVKNKTTGKILKEFLGGYSLTVDGKVKRVNTFKEILKTYPDVEISKYELKKRSHNKSGVRWVYTNVGGNKNYRVMFSVDSKKITVGYFKYKQDAVNCALETYVKMFT